MIKSKILWELSNYCTFDCVYCPSSFKSGQVTKPVIDYINAVELLQGALYNHVDHIGWQIKGGDPLVFPNIGQILKQIKSRPAAIEFHTSGGDTWFDIMDIINLVDRLKLTTHYWQNPSVLGFIIDYCKEHQVDLTVTVPLASGKILESRSLVQELLGQGIDAKEQVLRNHNLINYWPGYTQSDINLIEGRRADEDPVVYEVNKAEIKQTAVIIPDSTYVDLSKAPTDGSPSYTGKTCYAGIDYIEINSKGFINGSKCRGRTMGNIFEPDWKPVSDPFACPMLFCREADDRANIRIDQ